MIRLDDHLTAVLSPPMWGGRLPQTNCSSFPLEHGRANRKSSIQASGAMHIPRIAHADVDPPIEPPSMAWALMGGAVLGVVVWGLAIWKLIELAAQT